MKKLTVLILAMAPIPAQALTFTIPHEGNIVGHIQETTVQPGDDLSTIGRQFDIGGYEMTEANPGVSFLNPQPGMSVVIPSQFILPSGPRKDIVINLAEMRLYFYHPDGRKVSTYPIGIGKGGWLTPMGSTQVVRKRANPTWVVPDSILANRRAHGDPIPPVMPPGPDNPLGHFAMNLGFKNIVIHGSPFPYGIGMRKSHGCINMLNEDIEELYPMVAVGTKVRIVHEPVKIGMMDNQLYLESHVPLQESLYQDSKSLKARFQQVLKDTKFATYQVHWDNIAEQKQEANGIPQFVGRLN
jgi:L,D-transpeptidase ErfK/SrfK